MKFVHWLTRILSCFELIRDISLRLKKIGVFWSARVGLRYRSLAKERQEGLVWFWIGSHDRYDQLIVS